MPTVTQGISGQCPLCAAALDREKQCPSCQGVAPRALSLCSTKRCRLLFFCGAIILGTLLSAPLDAMQVPLLSVERLLADSLAAGAYFFLFRWVCRGMCKRGRVTAGRAEGTQANGNLR